MALKNDTTITAGAGVAAPPLTCRLFTSRASLLMPGLQAKSRAHPLSLLLEMDFSGQKKSQKVSKKVNDFILLQYEIENMEYRILRLFYNKMLSYNALIF